VIFFSHASRISWSHIGRHDRFSDHRPVA
jgi:hypothetical protein